MSTILKALRRLEKQKADSAPRPLRDEVVLPPAPVRRRRGWAPLLAVVIPLGLAAGIAVWFFGLRPGQPSEPTASSAPAQAPASPEAGAPLPVPETAPAVAAAPPDYEASPADGPADFEIVRPGGASAPLAPPPLPRVIEEELAAAPAEPAPPAFADPYAWEPEPEPVAQAPHSVRVERTEWHPDPTRRVAWVEIDGMTALRQVREGERVGPYTVSEIEPAAVLFADGRAEIRSEVGR